MKPADSDEEQPYVPEYEMEPVTFQLPHKNNSSTLTPNDSAVVTFVVWTVCPPPLEYMSALYNNHVEISGRKLWCGSLLLTQYIISMFYDTCYFYNKR